MAGIGGLTIRLALSELGPLGVFVNVDVPGGIIIVPPIGLAMNDFTASVDFFKTLPSIDDPQRLRDPAFQVTNTVTAANWLAGVKDQVFKQYLALKANPKLSGFSAAFTAPMVIKGSAKIYLVATSQEAFNGQVDVIISTDGKFLITGKLNFAANLLSVSGKLYADLSHVADGNVTVLFLADVPDQVRLLTIDGKLKLGFRDASGQEVAIPVNPDTPANTNTAATGSLFLRRATTRASTRAAQPHSEHGGERRGRLRRRRHVHPGRQQAARLRSASSTRPARSRRR